MWYAVTASVVIILAVAAFYFWREDIKNLGKSEQSGETYEHVMAEIREANDIRDRFRSDPAYHDRVQDRFTRR